MTKTKMRKRQGAESLEFERQEWLGDALLQFLSSRLLYAYYPHLSEGDLTLAREAVVSGGALAAAARACGLAREWGVDGMSDSVVAGKVEEYFARCYLGGGLTAADDAMQELLGGALTTVEEKIAVGATLKNPKTALQEITQSGGGGVPEYRLVKKTGADHKAYFFAECCTGFFDEDGNEVCAIGEGRTLRAAEQDAAQKCLLLLED